MNKKLMLLAVIAALGISGSAMAGGGDVFFSGNQTWGTSAVSGNAGFFFGSNNGNAAIFSGGSSTPSGNSQIWGELGGRSDVFVPYGSSGSGVAGGNTNYSFSTGHWGGSSYSSSNVSVNNWSSSSGEGNASSNVIINGNTNSWASPVFLPTPTPSTGEKG